MNVGNNLPDPQDFIGYSGANVDKNFTSYSYTTVTVLPELKGRVWDEVSLAHCMALKPDRICVVPYKGGVTLDARVGRITVWLDKEDKIDFISIEVDIPISEDHQNGVEYSMALNGRSPEDIKERREEGKSRYHNLPSSLTYRKS